MDHRIAHPVPVRGLSSALVALVRRLCSPLRIPVGPASRDSYLGPDGRPYERLCPWG